MGHVGVSRVLSGVRSKFISGGGLFTCRASRHGADLLKVARGQSPPPPHFGLWRSGASLVWWGGCMRGRCLGAIVDQLILGRFLADLGTFLTKQHRHKCNQNPLKFIQNPSQIDQNGAQERSKSDIGSKSFSRTTKSERPGCFF